MNRKTALLIQEAEQQLAQARENIAQASILELEITFILLKRKTPENARHL